MQSTVKKSGDKKEKFKDQDEKVKKTASTPRSYVQKSTTADIYSQNKRTVNAKAPRKNPGTSAGSTESPMTNYLKSSPSSVSQTSSRSVKRPTEAHKKVTTQGIGKVTDTRTPTKSTEVKTARRLIDDLPKSKITPESTTKKAKTPKELPMNVTVNSPPSQRKHLDRELFKEGRNLKSADSKDSARQRTKTRTLHENEVKLLKPVVDNNEEMMRLSRKLIAKPKAFYVDLDEDNPKAKNEKLNSSDDADVSYEDDFESYESDFDSYHSEHSDLVGEREPSSSETDEQKDEQSGYGLRDAKDEEKMLDSGSFDLRESQRSANKTKPAVMDFILEGSEDAADSKKASLTDEGFQEMSTSSAVSSLRTVHVDVLDRPLFIDFTKNKENKLKKRISDKLKQRAKDLLSMITLHEMSYSLFEMKPIPYDLYMATFGRSNYTQISVQTFDDAISEEVQTEDIVCDTKWTQCPIEFSKHYIYQSPIDSSKYGRNSKDYLTKFSFMIGKNSEVAECNKINTDKDYKDNSLRIYLEQKDGVGSCEMLPYECYKAKMKNTAYNVPRLSKFLKKVESIVSHALSRNMRNSEEFDLVQTSKLPFSKGYVPISTKTLSDDKLSFLKSTKISSAVFSDTKANLLMTIHPRSSSGILPEKCFISLWDISVARREPVKILVAIDNVAIGRFRGNSNGIFVAALEDGSLHLWDLSEEPNWQSSDAAEEKPPNLVEINSDRMTQTEIDREWNLRNRHVAYDQPLLPCTLQSCAYTSSAVAARSSAAPDCAVGLQLAGRGALGGGGGRRVLGEVCSLQRRGILTIWSIVQDKSKSNTHDLGKAYWSRVQLEIKQTISLIDHFSAKDGLGNDSSKNFNLNAAKRRLALRKQEKSIVKKENSRPISAISNFEFDLDRPASAASSVKTTMLPAEKNVSQSWESGVVCYDLKIMNWNKQDNYLVAKNCGEVLCCTRNAGAVKISRFCVATDMSSVTCLDVSPHGLPYFLAATDAGTVHLCSVLDARVLLTLDCRNGPPSEPVEKCRADDKGRYESSAPVRSPAHSRAGETRTDAGLSVASVHWSPTDPCSMYAALRGGAVALWELTRSDLRARCVCPRAATACALRGATLALLTPEGELQIHHLSGNHRSEHHLDLFHKYVSLL